MDETQLLQLAKNGDEAAFLQLIDDAVIKIRPTIFNTYPRLNYEDFKDCLQNAKLKAWQKINTFRGESTFSTWFFIILKREVLTCITRRNGISRYEISTEDIINANDNTQDYDTIPNKMVEKCVVETAQTIAEKKDEIKEYRKIIDEIYQRLSPTHCQIIKMIFEEGKTYKEVSNELNLSLGTVMSRLYYARKYAQKLIKYYAESNNIQLSNLGRR